MSAFLQTRLENLRPQPLMAVRAYMTLRLPSMLVFWIRRMCWKLSCMIRDPWRGVREVQGMRMGKDAHTIFVDVAGERMRWSTCAGMNSNATFLPGTYFTSIINFILPRNIHPQHQAPAPLLSPQAPAQPMDPSVTSDVDIKHDPSEVNSPSSLDDGSSQCSGDESDEYKEVVWDADTEICLLESIGKYPPTGVNRFFSILNTSILLKKRLNKRITPQQTLEHLNSLYNLEALVCTILFLLNGQ